jgi:hypothetical protein
VFVRFVIAGVDADSGRRPGLLQAIFDLEDKDELLPHEQQHFDRICAWFDRELEIPDSLARSSKPHAKKVAISWFKDSAREHIAKMYELVAILDAHGVHTEVLRTERPGYIVYEDDFQVAAEPFNETAA